MKDVGALVVIVKLAVADLRGGEGSGEMGNAGSRISLANRGDLE